MTTYSQDEVETVRKAIDPALATIDAMQKVIDAARGIHELLAASQFTPSRAVEVAEKTLGKAIAELDKRMNPK